jgi:hypothetical protein
MVNPSAFYGGLSLWALSVAERTSMTRRIHAFRGAFRGTVFNPNGRPVVFLVPASIAEEVRMLLQGVALPEEER